MSLTPKPTNEPKKDSPLDPDSDPWGPGATVDKEHDDPPDQELQ